MFDGSLITSLIKDGNTRCNSNFDLFGVRRCSGRGRGPLGLGQSRLCQDLPFVCRAQARVSFLVLGFALIFLFELVRKSCWKYRRMRLASNNPTDTAPQLDLFGVTSEVLRSLSLFSQQIFQDSRLPFCGYYSMKVD